MCDTVVVVREGQVLFAKNSDRDPNEAQVLEWHPRRTYPEGSRVRCSWIEIPQTTETHAVVLSRPFWMWGAEMGANEHGVVIGNEAVFTNQPYALTGLTGMDMLRLALERSDTAAAAVALLADMLDRFGQGGGCGHEDRGFTYHNSFLVADPGEAWVVETAGKQWAVEQVRSGVRSISNGLTIPGFAEAHSDRLRTTVSACRSRRALTGRVSRDVAPGDLMQVLRSHGEGLWPRYSVVNGAMAAPCMHAGGLVAASQTTASWVADIRPGDATHWVTATAAPCSSLFKPICVDAPVEHGPVPDDRFDDRTLWWRHERLHRLAMRDPAATMPTFVAERDQVERRWLAEPPSGPAAFAEADRLLDAWYAKLATAPPSDGRPWWVRRYWRIRDERAGVAARSPARAAA